MRRQATQEDKNVIKAADRRQREGVAEDEGGEEAGSEIRRWRKVKTSKESETEKILYEGWRKIGCSEQSDDTKASRLPPGGRLQQRNEFHLPSLLRKDSRKN